LRCQTFCIDNFLGNAWAARVLRETCPRATARALQLIAAISPSVADGQEWSSSAIMVMAM
jgi:hypothetical protein